MEEVSRRNAIKTLGFVGGIGLTNFAFANDKLKKEPASQSPFSYCFNTSCIMGQNLGIEKELEIVKEAGYDGIEVWIPALNQYKESGKSLKDLGKKISDLGLKVEDAIGFAQWIVNDETVRKQALEQARREMNMLAQIGGKRIAAPPAGATENPGLDLRKAGERYFDLLQIGLQEGVIPQLELWGFSQNLSRLSELLYVAAECGDSHTRILTDVYHLHKGGSSFDGLKLIAADAIEIFHMNDYPGMIDTSHLKDADRVHVGDGDAPISNILASLAHNREHVVLSLELFNPEYYKLDALEVAKTGLAKMKKAVEKAGF